MTVLATIVPLERHSAASIDAAATGQPLKFDRRSVDRRPTQAAATAFCLSGDSFGQMHDLRVTDYSTDGIGASSETVIEPGMTVSLGFQAPGRIARRGTVLRCVPCGHGYRVAIQFEQRAAA